MQLISDNLYHIYNQGNNNQIIFKEREDYLAFLYKTRKFLLPHCDILAYCLMPNHFHFLVNITEKSVQKIKIGGIEVNQVTNAFRLILSSYALDFNIKYNQKGSLFRQKTKGKCLTLDKTKNYPYTCFHYIHQNPYKANLVNKLEDWEFSSFIDYAGLRNGTLCNYELSKLYLNTNSDFINDTMKIQIDLEEIKQLI